MRNLLTSIIVAVAALAAAPVIAADYPRPPVYVPPPPSPEGALYLRGSAAVNMLWTTEHLWGCVPCASNEPTEAGFGYSIGAGVGYETGTGLRFDVTGDYLSNEGLTDGIDTLTFRAGLLLANAYIDIPLAVDEAVGSFGAYVGLGLGAAFYQTEVPGGLIPDGSGVAAAGAFMTGLTYDMGQIVGDLGYRMVYIPQLTNGQNSSSPFYLNDTFIHEVRGTIRYRLGE